MSKEFEGDDEEVVQATMTELFLLLLFFSLILLGSYFQPSLKGAIPSPPTTPVLPRDPEQNAGFRINPASLRGLRTPVVVRFASPTYIDSKAYRTPRILPTSAPNIQSMNPTDRIAPNLSIQFQSGHSSLSLSDRENLETMVLGVNLPDPSKKENGYIAQHSLIEQLLEFEPSSKFRVIVIGHTDRIPKTVREPVGNKQNQNIFDLNVNSLVDTGNWDMARAQSNTDLGMMRALRAVAELIPKFKEINSGDRDEDLKKVGLDQTEIDKLKSMKLSFFPVSAGSMIKRNRELDQDETYESDDPARRRLDVFLMLQPQLIGK